MAKKSIALIVFFILGITVASQSQQRELSLQTSRLNGLDVVNLQKQLIYLGYNIGPDGVDGWFGPDTKAALRSYQSNNGLETTGSISSNIVLANMSTNYSITYVGDKPTIEQPALKIINYNQYNSDVDRYNGEVRPMVQFRTYFGFFSFTYYAEAGPYQGGIGQITVENYTGRNLSAWIPKVATVSPNGRYIQIIDYDFGNSGSSEIKILDILTGMSFSVNYRRLNLPTDIDLGLRDTVYDINIFWMNENTVAINPIFDYQGVPAHPGHDEAWYNKLGDLAGTSDPIDVGWYLIEIEPAKTYLSENQDWFIVDITK